MGLQDQLTALRWLRANIGVFGGDRDKVTLAGAGRAAAMAHLLAINARTAGEYHTIGMTNTDNDESTSLSINFLSGRFLHFDKSQR